MTRGECRDEDAVVNRLTQPGVLPRQLEDVCRVMRDTLDAPRVERHRVHQVQVTEPHVLHRAHGGGDVHQVLRLEQHDADGVESGLSHGARGSG